MSEPCMKVLFWHVWDGQQADYIEELVPESATDEELESRAVELAIERSGVEGWFERLE